MSRPEHQVPSDELGYEACVDPEVDLAVRPSPDPWVVLREHAHLTPAIAVGGALGSLARWGVSEAMPHESGTFAWATLVENVSGALLLGLLMAGMLTVWSHTRYVRPFLGVGVLGGYTTFSTYVLDTRGMLAAGRAPEAFAYVATSIVLGLVAVLAGLTLGRAAFGRIGSPARDQEAVR